MGIIKIGSSANRKGIAVNPNTVLFNGNNVRKIMSGLVMIWNAKKALIPVMTSNTTPSGKVTASNQSTWNGFEHSAYKLFDGYGGGEGSCWGVITSGPNATNWCVYEFANNIIPLEISLQNASYNSPSGTFSLQFSNDNSTWDTVYTGNIGSINQNKQTIEVPENYQKEYRYFRFLVTGYTSYDGQWFLTMDSVQVYGYSA